MQGPLHSIRARSAALLAGLLALWGCGSVGDMLYDFDGDGSLDGDDCAPDDPDIFPGAPTDDYGDGVDSNCDGNDGIDNDLDGYPAPGPGVPAEMEDCNDSNAGINPDSEELPDDNIDQNCDGFDSTTVTGAPIVTISPLGPRTEDDLVATVNWDSGSTSLRWFVDGVEETQLAQTKTVPASATQKGQEWRALASAEIGGETREGEASVTVSNSPPPTESVQVLPGVGTVLDSFECFGSNSDADGDPLSYTYRWFVDDQEIDPTTSQITSAAGFVRGNWLDCEITATDGNDVGASASSTQSSTILNSPPSTPGPPTPAANGNAFTDEDLLCEASTGSVDPDADPLTYTMEWSKSSAQIPSLTAQFSQQDALSLQLNAAMTQRGDEWSCQIRANDGSQISASAGSATITIVNSLPTAPFIETDPYATSVVTPDQGIRCYIDGASSDADEDSITYHMEWLENGNSISIENTNATSNGDLLLAASYTDDGETFTCLVTPNDGLDDGPSGSAVVDVCGDTRISLQGNTDHVRIIATGISNYGSAGTIELWLWLATHGTAKLFDHWTGAQADIQLRLTGQGAVSSFMLYNLAPDWLVTMESPAGVIPTDEWVHIALQWDAISGSSLWVNGSQVDSNGTIMTPRSPANSSSIYLSENWVRTPPYSGGLEGGVQNLRISDIARYSSGTFTPPLELTVDGNTRALYRLDEGGGNGTDAAGNGGAAMPSGAGLWQPNQTCLNP